MLARALSEECDTDSLNKRIRVGCHTVLDAEQTNRMLRTLSLPDEVVK